MRSAMYEEERWARGVMVFVYPCRAGMRTFYAWDHVNKVELADSYPFMESHTNLSYSNVIAVRIIRDISPRGGRGWSLLSLLCKWQDLSSFSSSSLTPSTWQLVALAKRMWSPHIIVGQNFEEWNSFSSFASVVKYGTTVNGEDTTRLDSIVEGKHSRYSSQLAEETVQATHMIGCHLSLRFGLAWYQDIIKLFYLMQELWCRE